ncbi:MAG: hypothetical protein HYZ79_00960 [Candidatus Melainabacteria bacterium]|nr:hypothetical protein [Candidatus Melainabacteria bacterium]
MKSFCFKFTIIIIVFALSFVCKIPVFSIELQSAASSISVDTKDINSLTEVQQIEKLLDDLEKDWNDHNIEKVTRVYADDFVNGDGLNLEAVTNLTTELWEAYPDIMTIGQERTIRIDGDYATVYSSDIYSGTSKNAREEVGTKGTLRAVANGEVFLKKYGPKWKIVSDKTIYETVSIGYGVGADLVEENKIKLSAPEQVVSDRLYTATLDFHISEDLKPVASISKELLIYPQVTAEDKFRLVDSSNLERLFKANMISKNELITATVGLTGGSIQPTLLGLVFLSKRVNVIPVSNETDDISIIKEPAKSALNHKPEKTSESTKEEQTNNKEDVQKETED